MHAYLQSLAKGGEVAETPEAAVADHKACPTCGRPMAEDEPEEKAPPSFAEILKGRAK